MGRGNSHLQSGTCLREGIAAHLTLLEHPLMAAVVQILLVTYVRRSELLALRKKDHVPPLVPFLPCRSVEIAALETGMPTKTAKGRSS